MPASAPPDGETLAYAAVLAVLEGVDADALVEAMGDDGEEPEPTAEQALREIGPAPFEGAVFNTSSHRWEVPDESGHPRDARDVAFWRSNDPALVSRLPDGRPDPSTQDGILFIAKQLRHSVKRAGRGDVKDKCLDTASAIRHIYPEAEVHSGYYEGREDQAHTIFKLGGKFVDVTADQFGGSRVVVLRRLLPEYGDFNEFPEDKGRAPSNHPDVKKIADDLKGRLAPPPRPASEAYIGDDLYDLLSEAGRSGLQKKIITNANGHKQTVWVRTDGNDALSMHDKLQHLLDEHPEHAAAIKAAMAKVKGGEAASDAKPAESPKPTPDANAEHAATVAAVKALYDGSAKNAAIETDLAKHDLQSLPGAELLDLARHVFLKPKDEKLPKEKLAAAIRDAAIERRYRFVRSDF